MSARWTVIGLWLDEEPIVIGMVQGEHQVYGENNEALFPEGYWNVCVDGADDAAAARNAVAEMVDANDLGLFYNDHSNDIGDWCTWSGKPVDEDDLDDPDEDRCPALCRASRVEDRHP